MHGELLNSMLCVCVCVKKTTGVGGATPVGWDPPPPSVVSRKLINAIVENMLHMWFIDWLQRSGHAVFEFCSKMSLDEGGVGACCFVYRLNFQMENGMIR